MRRVTPLLFGICVISIACNRYESNAFLAQELKETVVNSVSYLDERKSSPFQIHELQLPERMANPRTVYFCDDSHGWVGGGDQLYMTQDAGLSWKQVGLEVPPGGDIAQILFLNRFLGWVVIRKESDYVLDYPEYRAWIMHTSDGGNSWSLQYAEKQVSAVRVAFSDEQNGWLVGVRYTGSKGITYTHFALKTNDQGRHWLDVSEGLVGTTSRKKTALGDAVNDGIMGIIAEGPLAAHVITARKQIIKTTTGGQTWQLAADVADESDQQSGIRQFSMAGNRLWLIASADSREGTHGTLTVEETSKSFVKHGLGGVYFADGMALSERQFLTCGYTKNVEKTAQGPRWRQEAVILYSDDSGSNWIVVYRNKNVKRISALTAVDWNHIWAVGERGLILRLEWSPAKGSVATNND